MTSDCCVFKFLGRSADGALLCIEQQQKTVLTNKDIIDASFEVRIVITVSGTKNIIVSCHALTYRFDNIDHHTLGRFLSADKKFSLVGWYAVDQNNLSGLARASTNNCHVGGIGPILILNDSALSLNVVSRD